MKSIGDLLVPFFVFYLLLDMHHLRTLFESHLPEQHWPEGRRLLDEITAVTRGYVQGRFLMALIMAGIYSAGLLLLGVPLWAAIGLIAGIIGIVPYLGVLSGLILALGFAALDGASFWRLAGSGGVFGVAQVIEDYVLTPRLIGNKLELHPMLVLLALMVGGTSSACSASSWPFRFWRSSR
jgi:predicted PurR-regulated permease PerM